MSTNYLIFKQYNKYEFIYLIFLNLSLLASIMIHTNQLKYIINTYVFGFFYLV